jgi:hypothetical protein
MNKDLNKYMAIAEQIKIVETVAKYSSFKLQVPEDSLYNYLMARIDRPTKNFQPQFGKDFKIYFTLSIRSYCLNYLRDKCSATNGQTNLRLVAKIKKWGIEGTAKRSVYSVEDLQDIWQDYKNNQSNRSRPLDEITEYISSAVAISNPYVDFVAELGGLEVVEAMDKNILKQLWKAWQDN